MSDNPWIFALQVFCCLALMMAGVGWATWKFISRGWH